MTSSFISLASNSLYSYRTLPPPTLQMQMATESPSISDSFSNSGGTGYTTVRPLFIPEKATTPRSPIYYPESPALPQYYPGPLSSSSERCSTVMEEECEDEIQLSCASTTLSNNNNNNKYK